MTSNSGATRRLLPSDLFHGSPNLRAASNVAFRYYRIRAALEAFTAGNQADDRRRRRWRIGLYREVVCLRYSSYSLFDLSNLSVARVQARHWGAHDLRVYRWKPLLRSQLSVVGY